MYIQVKTSEPRSVSVTVPQAKPHSERRLFRSIAASGFAVALLVVTVAVSHRNAEVGLAEKVTSITPTLKLAENDTPEHLAKGLALVADLLEEGSHAENEYFIGSPKSISFDPSNPYVHARCSSFVTLLLKGTYSWMTDDYFTEWFGTTSPNSVTQYNTITQGKHYTPVTKVLDIKPGDIIAINYMGASEGNSGHTMVAASIPEEMTNPAEKTRQPDTTQYKLQVLDMSSSYHNNQDTRYLHPGKYGKEGAGLGWFRFYANADGSINGYSWSTSSGSTYRSMQERPVAVGRLLNTEEPLVWPQPGSEEEEAASSEDAPAHVRVAEELIQHLLERTDGGCNSCEVAEGQALEGIDWSAEAACAQGVCSASFVKAALQEAYGWSDEQFRSWLGAADPSSTRWYDAMVDESNSEVSRVLSVADITPGDILAVRGRHTMIAASRPVPIASPPAESVVDGTTQYEIEVIDGANSPHGSADTRQDTTGQGIGRGSIKLYAHADGSVAGYAWSTWSGSTFYPVSSRPLAVGSLANAAPAAGGSSGPVGGPEVVVESGGNQDAAPAHALEAEALVASLGTSDCNSCDVQEGHSQGVVWTDGAACAQGCCGSAFIKSLLQHTYHWTDADFRAWFGAYSPSSTVWYDAITDAENEEVREIEHLDNVRAGDIIAIRSRHAMLVVAQPQLQATPPAATVREGTTQYTVDVIDGASSAHGNDDTRKQGTEEGVGRGTVRLYANEAGKLVGYAWSTYSGSTVYLDRELAVGRLTDDDLE